MKSLLLAICIFKVLSARKTYLITARARKNKRAARMLASARKDHSIPLFLRHRIKKFPDSPVHVLSDSLRIYFFHSGPVHTLSDSLRIYFFHSGKRIYFFRIRCRVRRIRVDGSRIRKEKVADSKISGYVWTGSERTFCLLLISPHGACLLRNVFRNVNCKKKSV